VRVLYWKRSVREIKGMKLSNVVYVSFVVLTSIYLTGCGAGNVKKAIGPDGSEIFSTKCKSDTAECFSTAGKTCDGSYKVLSSESHAGGVLADLLPGPVTWYGMTYVCGEVSDVLPDFPFRGPEYKPSRTVCSKVGYDVVCRDQ
jgi:hypothetical protein